MGHYSSFIIRLWVEPDKLGENWRWGMVQHVATRDRLRFHTAPELLEFITKYCGEGELSLPFALDGTEHAGDGLSTEQHHGDAPHSEHLE